MNGHSDKKVIVALTCYNRSEKTVNCIESLVHGNPIIEFLFVVVDDNSTDDTVKRLKTLSEEVNIHLIETQGDLYYSRGMKKALDYIVSLESKEFFDYLLLINDDVDFYENCIERMIHESDRKNNAVIVGPTCDKNGSLTYGGVKYLDKKTIKNRKMGINDADEKCDTFNANCVLIPFALFSKVGSYDSHYIHSLGDYDYGLTISKQGVAIYTASQYCGECVNNSVKMTWRDKELTLLQRIKKKEHPKGAPTKQWFYFLNKNFGLYVALKHTISPWIKLIFGV